MTTLIIPNELADESKLSFGASDGISSAMTALIIPNELADESKLSFGASDGISSAMTALINRRVSINYKNLAPRGFYNF